MSNSTIEYYIARHEQILRELLDSADIPAPRIKDAMSYALFPGGKRLRPVLVYLSGELINANPSSMDIIAASIELTHCYSLIHDDLPAMDDDDLRRGRPSCHRAFDEATAILVGDGMQALAIELLLHHLPDTLSLPQVVAVTHELVKASGPCGMVSGQSLDLSELSNPNITESQLRDIHMLKTGKLILACINMALVAGAPSPEDVTALRQFANHLGLVFQMQDDYLDRYGSTSVLGKARASDSANQKTTFANLYQEHELSILIDSHFQQATQCLVTFGQRADSLIQLMRELHLRTQEAYPVKKAG